MLHILNLLLLFYQSILYSWTVPLLGGTVGAGFGLTTASTSNPTSIIAKSNELRFDSQRVRMDDLHLIGGAVGALLLPAIFCE